MFTLTGKSNKKIKKRLLKLEGRQNDCDTKHENQQLHNRRHDDSFRELIPLVPAVKELTEAVKGLKQRDLDRSPLETRVKNNFTAWDVWIETSKQIKDIVGSLMLVSSAAYGLLKFLEVI